MVYHYTVSTYLLRDIGCKIHCSLTLGSINTNYGPSLTLDIVFHASPINVTSQLPLDVLDWYFKQVAIVAAEIYIMVLPGLK